MGDFGSLELVLPSPSSIPDPAYSSVPFPSSAPISLSCPSKYDDDLGCDFRSCSFTETAPHGTDPWPVDQRRKRAKSCLASSYVHRDAHDSRPPANERRAPQSSGYEPDTEAGSPAPARKRRLAHSVRRASAKKALKGQEKSGRRTESIDVQFAATMHRTIAWHLRCAQEAYRTRTRSGSSDSEAYGGIVEDVDVDMGEADDTAVLLDQDHILVERLACILAEQGIRPARESAYL